MLSDRAKPPGWDELLAELCQVHDVDRSLAAREALDEQADASWLPWLYEVLANGEDFFVRESVAEPIIRLDGLRALPQLLQAMHDIESQYPIDECNKDNVENVKTALRAVAGLSFQISELIELHAEGAVAVLTKMLNDTNPRTRGDAEWLMGFAIDPPSNQK